MKKLNSGLFYLMSSCFIARQNNRLINRQVQHDAMQKKKQAVSYNTIIRRLSSLKMIGESPVSD